MDILITRGKHRVHIISKTPKGSRWITINAHVDGVDGSDVWFSIDPSLIDEMYQDLVEDGLEVEVK